MTPYRWTSHWINTIEDLDSITDVLSSYYDTRFRICEIKFKTTSLKLEFHKRFLDANTEVWNTLYGAIKLSS